MPSGEKSHMKLKNKLTRPAARRGAKTKKFMRKTLHITKLIMIIAAGMLLYKAGAILILRESQRNYEQTLEFLATGIVIGISVVLILLILWIWKEF